MAAPQEITFHLNGKRWRFLREYLPEDRDGDCDPPTTKGKAIRVDKRAKGKLELYLTLHEVRHAENWHMYDEDYVKQVSHDHTNLLWRLGYRRLTPEEIALVNSHRGTVNG